MDDVRRVQKLERSEHLVDEVLYMLRQELLSRADYSAQVSLHQFADKVNVTKNLTREPIHNKPVLIQLVVKFVRDLPVFGNVDYVK